MILFIHGFGSCGWGEKSLLLRRHFGIAQLLAPDLPFHPQAAYVQLEQILARHPVRAVIGSSLGGFMATALNAQHRLPAILINPVVRPHRLLSAFLGRQQRWCDQMPFEVSAEYLDTLKSLHREKLSPEERYLVLLQEGDEVLDYREAAAYYPAQAVYRVPGGSHRFDKLGRHLPLIDRWLQETART